MWIPFHVIFFPRLHISLKMTRSCWQMMVFFFTKRTTLKAETMRRGWGGVWLGEKAKYRANAWRLQRALQPWPLRGWGGREEGEKLFLKPTGQIPQQEHNLSSLKFREKERKPCTQGCYYTHPAGKDMTEISFNRTSQVPSYRTLNIINAIYNHQWLWRKPAKQYGYWFWHATEQWSYSTLLYFFQI